PPRGTARCCRPPRRGATACPRRASARHPGRRAACSSRAARRPAAPGWDTYRRCGAAPWRSDPRWCGRGTLPARPTPEPPRGAARATAVVGRRLAIPIRTVVGGDRALGGAHLAGDLGGARSAVVALEHEQRVAAHATPLERVEDPADLLVHRRDHRGVGAPI